MDRFLSALSMTYGTGSDAVSCGCLAWLVVIGAVIVVCMVRLAIEGRK